MTFSRHAGNRGFRIDEPEAPYVQRSMAYSALIADFRDAQATRMQFAGGMHRSRSARHYAELLFTDPPKFVRSLMDMRDIFARAAGLRTFDKTASASSDRIGRFDVIRETPSDIMLGADDRHLDFRISVLSEWRQDGLEIGIVTCVKTKNRFGKSYLAVVAPFHRRIVRTMLSQLSLRLLASENVTQIRR